MHRKVDDPKDFRRALSHFPTGVIVATTIDSASAPIGCTASSFNAVSLDPPLVLWSIDKSAWSAVAFRESGGFAVNVLSAEQVAISNRFAQRGDDKFANFDWATGSEGWPVFAGTVACFECRTWAVYDGGDHWIIVGEVQAYSHDATDSPLLFSRGGYGVPQSLPTCN